MLRATVAEVAAVREAGEKTTALNEKGAALATARGNEIRATAAQKDAQENLKDALAAVDQMLTRVAEERLLYVPQMEAVRRELLQDALKFYRKFLEKKSDDPVIRLEAALALLARGRIQYFLGQYAEAEKAYRTGIGILEELARASPLDFALRVELLEGPPPVLRAAPGAGKGRGSPDKHPAGRRDCGEARGGLPGRMCPPYPFGRSA